MEKKCEKCGDKMTFYKVSSGGIFKSKEKSYWLCKKCGNKVSE